MIVDGQPVSIRHRLPMHEVLAPQLAEDDTPEVYVTAQRLLGAAYGRHGVPHMLAAPIVEQIHATLQDGAGDDRDRHLAALVVLPEPWERRRTHRTINARTR